MEGRKSNAPALIGGRNRQVHSSEGHTAADTEKETGHVRNESCSSTTLVRNLVSNYEKQRPLLKKEIVDSRPT